MTEKNINKEAYKQAEKELLEEKISRVKGLISKTLKGIEEKKQEKEKIEEELRILKLNLEDLKNGNIEKIEERIEKSKVAERISIPLNDLVCIQEPYLPLTWSNFTSGTYCIKYSDSNGNNINKTFYL